MESSTSLKRREKSSSKNSDIVKKQKNISLLFISSEIWFYILEKIQNDSYFRLLSCVCKTWNQFSKELSLKMNAPFDNYKRQRRKEKNFYSMVEDFIKRKDFHSLEIFFVFNNHLVLRNAAEHGYIHILHHYGSQSLISVRNSKKEVEELKVYFNDAYNYECLNKAIEYGHMKCVKYIIQHENCPKINQGFAINLSALEGHFDIFCYLIQDVFPNNWKEHSRKEIILADFLRCGNHRALLFLEKEFSNDLWQSMSNYDMLMNHAVAGGNLDCVKFLREKKNFRSCSHATHFAIQYGHMDCYQYLIKEGFSNPNNASETAAKYGKLEFLKYFFTIRIPFTKATVKFAIINHHDLCVEFLHKNNCPKYEKACYYAALTGNLKLLKLFHENEYVWNEKTFDAAAKNGNIEIIEYLFQNHCPWNENACNKAALSQKLNILKFLIQNGCPYNIDQLRFISSANNDQELLEYLSDK